jgi:FKBP-type peptidyl-prolyl cis-trans isomerase FkpA
MVVSTDYDVTFTKIVAGTATANLLRIKDEYTVANTKLVKKVVTISGVDHNVYYMPLRVGTEFEPSRVDSVFVSYKGRLMDETTTTFDQAQNPIWLTLDATIQGWREVFPEFKSGTFTDGGNGAVNYMNYGAGVMFLPSALAYYNSSQGTIPAYSPLIFSFKLRHLNYVDHDLDGIDSRNEDLNGDKKFTLEFDDSDGDGRLNYLDQDDDGDNFSTKYERKNPLGGYFSFATIPLCTSGSNGKKRYLDPACHN